MPKLSGKAIVVVVLVLFVLGGAGVWWLLEGQYYQTTNDAYIEADKLTISSKLPGFIQSGWIKDNEPVIKNALLARIEDKDYRANLQLALANVESAKANISNVRAQLILQNSLIKEAKSAISADEATLVQATDDVKRYTRLSGSGFSSERDLESAVVARKAAEAALVSAKATFQSKKEQKKVLDASLQQAMADLSARKASLSKAKADINSTMIHAPEDGIIAQRLAHNGEYVGAGTPLFSLVDMNTVWVVANFKETQVEHIKPGLPVTIEVDSFSDHPITGYVDSLVPGSGAEFSILPPENATGNFTKVVQRIPVKIVIPKGQGLSGYLRPGMSVVVTINTKDKTINLGSITTSLNNRPVTLTEKQTVVVPSEEHHG
ncbi:MAG: HlyD family secretion protein [Endozoicomonas sp. (ex Botrylloides leachii)]|nr:HlyD family secretion protein [Endozoicomonas sp. (ex Botrylloides leachii)]